MSNRACPGLIKLAVPSMFFVAAAAAGCGGGGGGTTNVGGTGGTGAAGGAAGTGGDQGTLPPNATCVVPTNPVDTSSPTTAGQ